MNVINLVGVKWFIEDYVKNRMVECYRNPKRCKELEELKRDLKDIIALCRSLIDEVEIILKAEKGVSALTSTEYMTIALAQRPNAPLSVKRKAQEIIYRYKLTPEQVKAIYESVYGKY